LSISNIESIYNYCTYELNVNGYSDMCNLLTKNELTMFDYEASLNGSLSFFNNKQYKYFVTDADVQLEQLTKLNNSKPNKYTGENMAREFGYNFYSKYGHLVSENETLTVFASNSTRVKDTAKFFGEGFVQNTNINFEVLVISENETPIGTINQVEQLQT